jgi:RNA polymerase sigma factor (sigma-70 family)
MNDDISSLHTRPSLLVRIRDRQDVESWRTFVELYTPPVLRYCRMRGLQDADAADVTQEVLAQVARSMHSFGYQPERGRFRDWLGTITRRMVSRHLTKKNLGTTGTGGDRAPQAFENLTDIEADAEWTAEFNAQILRVALDRVRPLFAAATWKAFASTWLENRSAVETSVCAVRASGGFKIPDSRFKRFEKETIPVSGIWNLEP